MKMNKLWSFNLFYLLAMVFILKSNITTELQDVLFKEHGLDNNQFCNYVYRRFYFVKRLHNTMLLFLDVEDRIKKKDYKHTELDSMFNFTPSITFTDMRIQRSIDLMTQKRSLKPLFMIWDDFTSYKSIKDQLFVEEFTKEVFIISRNMLITLASHDEFVVVPPIRLHVPLEELLNDIDIMTKMIYQLQVKKTSLTYEHNARIVDLHTFAHIDDVMMRYYLIKRLKYAINQLDFHSYHKPFIKQKIAITWHHPHIITCIHVMEQSATLDPLYDLWDDVLQYKYIQDDLFMHEFAQLILVTYTDLLTYYNEHQESSHKDALSAALELYQLIDKLPLNEILDIIDIITHDLPPLLEKYEFDTDMSWQAWLRKYWWAPPIIIATIAIHILMNWEAKNALAHPAEIQPHQVSAPPAPPILKPSSLGDYEWLLLQNSAYIP